MFPDKPKTFDEQIDLLKARGLTFQDEAFAKRCLEHCNYYRLSIYWRELWEEQDKFKSGATFEEAWELYTLDRELRALVWQATKVIEISARTQWAYVFAHNHGACEYDKPSHFLSLDKHKETIDRLKKELNRSCESEKFLKWGKEHYGTLLLETWKVCEVFSFGTTSMLISGLADRDSRTEISNRYTMGSSCFCSTLHHLTAVRNIVAHHGRLWNRELPFTLPQNNMPAPLKRSLNLRKTNCFYNSLTTIVYLLKQIDKKTPTISTLKEFSSKVPKTFRESMGFPLGWETRKVWQDK